MKDDAKELGIIAVSLIVIIAAGVLLANAVMGIVAQPDHTPVKCQCQKCEANQ
jgi:hypothetical protein